MTRDEIIHHQNLTDMTKGALGCGSTLIGVITSHLAELEVWLRVSSLCVGIAVGIATFISIRRRK